MSEKQKVWVLQTTNTMTGRLSVAGLYLTESEAKDAAAHIVKTCYDNSDYEWNDSGHYTEFDWDYIEPDTKSMAGSIGMGGGSRTIPIIMYLGRHKLPTKS